MTVNEVLVDTFDMHMRFYGKSNFCGQAGPAVEVFPEQGFDPSRSVTCQECLDYVNNMHITFQNDSE